MSPFYWHITYSNANVFFVYGSGGPGYLSNTNVNDTNGVVRPSNFSFKKIFHNFYYSRKNLRETNIIHCL